MEMIATSEQCWADVDAMLPRNVEGINVTKNLLTRLL